MRLKSLSLLSALVVSVSLVSAVQAADLTDSLKKGTPDLKSAGPLAFGPEGILFVGDTQGAAIFALDTQDRTASAGNAAINIKDLNQKLADLLGTTTQQILVTDLAVNPVSGNAYLALSRGRGPDATPVLVRADRSGKLEPLSLADIGFAKAPLPNPPGPNQQQRGRSLRSQSITDLAYLDGRVIVAGLSNEEFASRLFSIPFPFAKTDSGAGIEIYHGAHGAFETRSPIRTFVPFDIAGETHLLAAYTCTPLVRIPVSELKAGAQVKGTTVAELGNRNNPLDMIVYKKEGKNFLLLANSSRGVMKISTENIDKAEGITDPVRGGGTKGQSYDTIAELKDVQHLDRLDDSNALILVQSKDGPLDLVTIATP